MQIPAGKVCCAVLLLSLEKRIPAEKGAPPSYFGGHRRTNNASSASSRCAEDAKVFQMYSTFHSDVMLHNGCCSCNTVETNGGKFFIVWGQILFPILAVGCTPAAEIGQQPIFIYFHCSGWIPLLAGKQLHLLMKQTFACFL